MIETSPLNHPDAHRLDQVGETIWHNGIPTIKAKAELVLDQELGGVMIWSLDNDVKGVKSLLDALDEVLNPEKPDRRRLLPMESGFAIAVPTWTEQVIG